MVTSVALALLVTGCGVDNANETNNDANGVGFNTRNTQDSDSGINVNRVNNPITNGANPNNLTDPITNEDNRNNMTTPITNRDDPNDVRNVGYGNFNDDDFEISDDIANRVAGLKEVKSATVVLTDHRAYVAAVLNNDEGKNVSTKVENKIANTVRGADHSIDQVYVSTNPDFVDRLKQYAGDVRKGRPVAGFGQEFGELVNRVFPNSR
jgi:spore cortex protein